MNGIRQRWGGALQCQPVGWKVRDAASGRTRMRKLFTGGLTHKTFGRGITTAVKWLTVAVDGSKQISMPNDRRTSDTRQR